jgi:hypothetical protein
MPFGHFSSGLDTNGVDSPFACSSWRLSGGWLLIDRLDLEGGQGQPVPCADHRRRRSMHLVDRCSYWIATVSSLD